MSKKKFLRLNDSGSYRIVLHLSKQIWETGLTRDHFSKITIGQHIIRAIDSISANIPEGFGRYGKKDTIKFYRYALGSTYESPEWNEKAKIRGLFTQYTYKVRFSALQKLLKAINSLIKFTHNHLTI